MSIFNKRNALVGYATIKVHKLRSRRKKRKASKVALYVGLGLISAGILAAVVALDSEATIETVADGMAPHPTLSEGLKEAGLVALGRPIHLPPRRK